MVWPVEKKILKVERMRAGLKVKIIRMFTAMMIYVQIITVISLFLDLVTLSL